MGRSRQISGTKGLRRILENQGLLKVGARGGDVAILQASLIRMGFAMPRSTRGGKAYPDGIFGSETKQTVERFQRAAGLKPDGLVGPRTLGRLDEFQAEFEEHRSHHSHVHRAPTTYRLTVREDQTARPGRRVLSR